MKAYVYLNKVLGFSVHRSHANKLIKHEIQVSSYFSVWRCGFSSVKLAHQKSKPVMPLSQVKLAEIFAIDSIRDRHEIFKHICIFCDEIFNKLKHYSVAFKLTLLTFQVLLRKIAVSVPRVVV